MRFARTENGWNIWKRLKFVIKQNPEVFSSSRHCFSFSWLRFQNICHFHAAFSFLVVYLRLFVNCTHKISIFPVHVLLLITCLPSHTINTTLVISFFVVNLCTPILQEIQADRSSLLVKTKQKKKNHLFPVFRSLNKLKYNAPKCKRNIFTISINKYYIHIM